MKILGDQIVQGIIKVSKRIVEGLRSQLVTGNYNLTSRSEKFYRFTATSAATVTLPDATTLSSGYEYIFYTTSTDITLQDYTGTAIQLFEPGTVYYVYLMNNATSDGEWVVSMDTSYDVAVGTTNVPAAGVRAYYQVLSTYTGTVGD